MSPAAARMSPLSSAVAVTVILAALRDGHLVGEQPAFPGGVPGHAAPDDRPGLPHKAQVDGAAARGLAPEAVRCLTMRDSPVPCAVAGE